MKTMFFDLFITTSTPGGALVLIWILFSNIISMACDIFSLVSFLGAVINSESIPPIKRVKSSTEDVSINYIY